jgi:1-acyl-sn-glycerol-3-phosphate acyltransferase
MFVLALTEKNPQYSKLTPEHLNSWNVAFHLFSQGLIRIWYWYKYKLVVHGQELIPKGFQSYVCAANHTSDLDPTTMAMALQFRPVSYMAKKELFYKPLSALFFRMMGTFAVDRDKLEVATIKSALTVLKTKRWVLGIFPEGGRVKQADEGTVKVAKPKRGAAYLAHAGKVPILPMGIVIRDKNIMVQIGQMIPHDDNLEAMNEALSARLAELVEICNSKMDTLLAKK